ncbi:O-linked N-acetylglucosamine transferase, SPINDLY family protein [Roseateles koreensis]|uniref:Acetylglucosamine transferase n=1 Tax=Roseateles koreensis TaxID=2987526 RepID=A0ABT5KVV4_9BURK|nr:acetylglucosamine transferase [Roseateles koreensis]MDC8786916.1 acetylglucosamine transferase [Roseateles koreensis]
MDLSSPAVNLPEMSPGAQTAMAKVEQLLAHAGSGNMPFDELMRHASSWESVGMVDAAALLYQNWIAATRSVYLHIACYNWGALLGTARKHVEAERAYRLALSLNANFKQARLNLGHQLEHQGRIEDALTEWLAVAEMENLKAEPGEGLTFRLHGLNNAARMLETQRRFPEAEALMRFSLLLKPTQGDVIQHFVHIRQKQCAWPIYQPFGQVTANQLLVNTSLLATLSATDDPAVQLMVAQRFVHDRVKAPPEGLPLHQQAAAKKPRTGRIKIGYLSGDLCMHAVGLLTAELFELHDRERFEVHAFCWSREDGTPLRARLMAAMDKTVSIAGLNDTQAAQMIADAGIDILVDLQGLTAGARPNILTQRPAPIQVSYLGLPATSAMPGVDWIIADRFVMPPEYLPYCTEKPIYLPNCYQVSDRQRESGAVPTRAQYGLPAQGFVFCSFNNNHKFSEEMFRCWMRILNRVPDSVLWLLADNDWAQANMLRVAAESGVAAERLIFAPRVAPPDYLARFVLADLVLDTFPYNAGTTASDCLWMGTPILTRSGRSYISRMAGSLLSAVGLPDLITFNLPDYEARAVQIGLNPARAASYKRYLQDFGRQSALFDMPRVVRDMEAEFERLALQERLQAS